MLARLVGALVRAAIVVLVVATPSLLLPGTTQEGAQMVMLVGLTLGLFTAIEYGSTYPALIEFRDAPPFNRVRILSLLFMLFFLSVVAGGSDPGSTLPLVLNALGLLIGEALDVSWSPLTVVLNSIPATAAPVSALQVKVMTGLAAFISLAALVVFALLLRLQQWPSRGQAFNVWVNLPTFDPTTGGDVVARLTRDARVNIILGISVAFILPVVGLTAANHIGLQVVASPHAMVWGIALWMFLPLSMVMRGMAMARIAGMIRQRRARLVASVGADAARLA
ncbi:hypothetical protein HCU73_00685 [Roseibacterium sp. KMU-115]|uniref:Uncharacterized protein n=2 Tax=Roseicyclus persicicus TaxID=2650661 RepID=A0A7X6JV91_9RHOB|nr:hypothetical protein [Roseibacterium persicicum]